MQLTQYTDFSLRVLIYTGLKMKRCTIKEISQNFNISQNHLLKVVHKLGKLGWIRSIKGKGGGIEIAEKALHLTIKDVVLEMEPNLNFLECFQPETNTCPLIGYCKLERLLLKSREAFLNELSLVRVADLISTKKGDVRLKILKIKT
jgi:Rrf2 family nitric oxide-sensitive transcriptional repressor